MPTITPATYTFSSGLRGFSPEQQDAYKKALSDERLNAIVQRNPSIERFIRLAVVSSPTVRPGHPKEQEMKRNIQQIRELTAEIFKELDKNITTYTDEYGSLIIKVPGSPGYEDRQPLMFIGHLDMVPADLDDPLRQVYPRLINHPTEKGVKEFIASDGTTTLAADDKAQVAIIFEVVRRSLEKSHIPFEIILAPDEEEENESITHLDTSKIKSGEGFVVDNDRAFKGTTGAASFVDIKIDVNGLTSGHSGVDNQNDFVSAADILIELCTAIGNRVVKWNPAVKDPSQPLISKNIYECEIKRAPDNAFPTQCHIAISLRSLTKSDQDAELTRIAEEVKRIGDKYRNIEIKLETKEKYPPWNGNPESAFVKLVKQAAHNIGHNEVELRPSHGASSANILDNMRNAYGEKFNLIVVAPDIEDLHSVNEKVDWKSMIEVSNWLDEFVQLYTQRNRQS